MKRVCALVLAVLLVFTGCTGGIGAKNVSVKDVCCPYEIVHKKGAVELTLRDGAESGLLWNVESLPADLCAVTQEDAGKEYETCYRITGAEEGIAQLTFTASQEDGTVVFVLDLMVNVDAEGQAAVSSCQHRERSSASVAADGLDYEWHVDVDGVLHFSLFNDEDKWSVQGDGANVCGLLSKMAIAGGCQFSVEAKEAGSTTFLLVGKTTQRKIGVVVQVDENGNLEIVSVQEQ